MSFLSVIFGYLCVPELKGRSLEEIEVMFEARVPLRKFGNYQSDPDGIGSAVSRIERLESDDTAVAKMQAHIHSDSLNGEADPPVKRNGM